MNILTSKPFDYQAAVQYQLRYLMMQDSAEYDFDIFKMNNDKIHTCDFK